MNNHFHNTLRIKDGESYVASWNASFLNYITKTYPDSNLSNKLNAISTENHLDKTKDICNVLNIILKSKEASKYYKRTGFNIDDVVVRKQKRFSIMKSLTRIFK